MKTKAFSIIQFFISVVPIKVLSHKLKKIILKAMSHLFFKNGVLKVEIALEKAIKFIFSFEEIVNNLYR